MQDSHNNYGALFNIRESYRAIGYGYRSLNLLVKGTTDKKIGNKGFYYFEFDKPKNGMIPCVFFNAVNDNEPFYLLGLQDYSSSKHRVITYGQCHVYIYVNYTTQEIDPDGEKVYGIQIWGKDRETGERGLIYSSTEIVLKPLYTHRIVKQKAPAEGRHEEIGRIIGEADKKIAISQNTNLSALTGGIARPEGWDSRYNYQYFIKDGLSIRVMESTSMFRYKETPSYMYVLWILMQLGDVGLEELPNYSTPDYINTLVADVTNAHEEK